MNGGGAWGFTSPPLDQRPREGGGLYSTNDSLYALTSMSIPTDFGSGRGGNGWFVL